VTHGSDLLAGRVAIVTGASRGIGLAIAKAVAAAGGSVCITARKRDALDAALAELRAPRAMAVAGRADDPEHQRDAVEQTVAAFGPVNLLVNNAAVNPLYGPLIDADAGAMRKVFDVNVIAALQWTALACKAGMSEHGGSVVNIASVGGVAGEPNLGAYNVSKAALIHMTRQLALELAPSVRVNAIAPAVVKTRFAERLLVNGEDAVAAMYPLRRLGEVADVAETAVFLLSDHSSWITGQTVVLDGGLTLTRSYGEGEA
jgi:3-oxoacyl-[acyl-carrier protein] reductase